MSRRRSNVRQYSAEDQALTAISKEVSGWQNRNFTKLE